MYCSSPNEEKRHKAKNSRSFRQKLQKQFDKESPKTSCLPSFGTSGTTPSSNMEERNSTERSILTSLSNLSDTKKVFRTSAEKISKTFNNVRTSIGSFSQKFKISTKRRQRLEECPMTPSTPISKSRAALGRTPTKLYSPFGIESPIRPSPLNDKENTIFEKESSTWISKKPGKKLKAVRMSLSKWNNIVNANQYADMSPDHKKGCGFNYPIKLRA